MKMKTCIILGSSLNQNQCIFKDICSIFPISTQHYAIKFSQYRYQICTIFHQYLPSNICIFYVVQAGYIGYICNVDDDWILLGPDRQHS